MTINNKSHLILILGLCFFCGSALKAGTQRKPIPNIQPPTVGIQDTQNDGSTYRLGITAVATVPDELIVRVRSRIFYYHPAYDQSFTVETTEGYSIRVGPLMMGMYERMIPLRGDYHHYNNNLIEQGFRWTGTRVDLLPHSSYLMDRYFNGFTINPRRQLKIKLIKPKITGACKNCRSNAKVIHKNDAP